MAKIYSAELEGIKARLVEVEVDLHVGLHAFNIVGLADKAVSEAKERVNSALKNSGVKPPNRENRKITVNLAPADLKKTGSHYDFAIAMGYLLATEQIKDFGSRGKLFLGELALDGRLRPVSGALNITELAAQKGFEQIFVPVQNANEAAAISGISVIPIESLAEAMEILENKRVAESAVFHETSAKKISAPDFAEIRGQENAKRALTIAASGGHNMLMIGPPGVGKSLLAQAMTGILPDLAPEEAIEVTKIYSAAGLTPDGLVNERPFRSPHQTASLISIVGGGTNPRPGEISLAHRGILFLDELPEFPKNILESLRQPLESGIVHVARARGTLSFPAKFSLIAAMNPCPCGFYGDPEKECRCGAFEVIRYQKKISGPLLDRIDLQVRVPRIPLQELRGTARKESASSADVKRTVERVRRVQAERFKKTSIRVNAEMSSKQTEQLTELDHDAEKFLKTLEQSRLSPRGYYRLLKTARTIADLDKSEKTRAEHLAEAFSYRLREEI
jgi:magnesium chelatase family protein